MAHFGRKPLDVWSPNFSRDPHAHEYIQLSPVKDIPGCFGQGCYSREFYSVLMGIPTHQRV